MNEAITLFQVCSKRSAGDRSGLAEVSAVARSSPQSAMAWYSAALVERMGLLDQVRARATGVRAGTVVDGCGRRVASMDGDTFGGRDHDDAEILRCPPPAGATWPSATGTRAGRCRSCWPTWATTSTSTRSPRSTWTAGRPAASVASEQGTSLALVGAYVLAGELAAADHTEAFAGYEAALREFVTANQKLGPASIRRMVLATRARVRTSMAFLSLLSRIPGRDRLLAKAVAPLHRAANAITLKDYTTG